MPSKIRPPAVSGLPRERLEAALASLETYRLALVVAPAGSGKTTLLARLAAITGVPTAWYRAEVWERDEASLVAHLRLALRTAIGGLDDSFDTVDDLLRALDAGMTERAALVIDDLHALEGTPAEQALERLVDYGPALLTVLAGSRVQPGFNLSRLRVSGDLVEIGSDDLRFRPWEVERLFRDHYLQQVPPQELAVLARRTEGWAAGLQLFHLATRSKSPDERRRILAGVASGSRLTREYLARNVLGDLSDELRRFLVETSVLGRLSGPYCDELLGQNNSRSVLEELERRQIFTTALDDEGVYRYHEVLRSHLFAMLVEERGEAAARAHHVRAGRLLEAAGESPDALGAYSRGEDWASVERILGRTGEALLSRPGGWLDALPPSLVRHDPWLLLASARHARDEGRWKAALDAYLRAEKGFGSADAAIVCRRERIGLAGWLEPMPTPGSHWTDTLRAATIRDPGAARRSADSLSGWTGRLVAGLALLLAGYPRAAREALAAAIDDEATPPTLAAAAALAEGTAALMAGDPGWSDRVEAAASAAERLGVRWLSRLGRAALVLGQGGHASEVAAAVAACRDDGDPWGEALIELCRAWFADDTAERWAAAGRSAALARGLGAGSLEAWARSLAASGSASDIPARPAGAAELREAALQAESFARAVATPGPRLLAYLVLARADPTRAQGYGALIESLGGETGLVVPMAGSGAMVASTPPAPAPPSDEPMSSPSGAVVAGGTGGTATNSRSPLTISLLGGFSLGVGDRSVDLGQVKPRARALLRFLALHGGSRVHREVIAEALWPDGDRDAPAKSLQVALSTLRRLLEPGPERASSYLVRDGDAYRLDLPAGSSIDIHELEAAVSEARLARAARDVPRGREAARRALELYRGELLPEDGPATWVVEPREHMRVLASQAAQWLAESSLAAGDAGEAARAVLVGLAADRYSDPLWRLLIEAHDAAGDRGAAGRARRDYARVLTGLGVHGEDGRTGQPQGAGLATSGAANGHGARQTRHGTAGKRARHP